MTSARRGKGPPVRLDADVTVVETVVAVLEVAGGGGGGGAPSRTTPRLARRIASLVRGRRRPVDERACLWTAAVPAPLSADVARRLRTDAEASWREIRLPGNVTAVKGRTPAGRVAPALVVVAPAQPAVADPAGALGELRALAGEWATVTVLLFDWGADGGAGRGELREAETLGAFAAGIPNVRWLLLPQVGAECETADAVSAIVAELQGLRGASGVGHGRPLVLDAPLGTLRLFVRGASAPGSGWIGKRTELLARDAARMLVATDPAAELPAPPDPARVAESADPDRAGGVTLVAETLTPLADEATDPLGPSVRFTGVKSRVRPSIAAFVRDPGIGAADRSRLGARLRDTLQCFVENDLVRFRAENLAAVRSAYAEFHAALEASIGDWHLRGRSVTAMRAALGACSRSVAAVRVATVTGGGYEAPETAIDDLERTAERTPSWPAALLRRAPVLLALCASAAAAFVAGAPGWSFVLSAAAALLAAGEIAAQLARVSRLRRAHHRAWSAVRNRAAALACRAFVDALTTEADAVEARIGGVDALLGTATDRLARLAAGSAERPVEPPTGPLAGLGWWSVDIAAEARSPCAERAVAHRILGRLLHSALRGVPLDATTCSLRTARAAALRQACEAYRPADLPDVSAVTVAEACAASDADVDDLLRTDGLAFAVVAVPESAAPTGGLRFPARGHSLAVAGVRLPASASEEHAR